MKFKDANVRKVVEDHAFPPDRGLNAYIELFGFEFANALKSLKPLSHWLDSGAGEGQALREFHHVTSKKDVLTTAVGLKSSSQLSVKGHKNIVNYLEDLPQDEIRPCDIVTDIEGPFQFTEQPDIVLKKYLLWLKPQGTLFLYVRPETFFVERTGAEITFREWIGSLPGLSVENGASEGAYVIRKKEGNHSIPRVKLLATRLDPVLRRKFREM